MKKIVLFLLQNFLFAQNFNENLTAVHYSIASAGIDYEIKPGESLLKIQGHFNMSTFELNNRKFDSIVDFPVG